MSTAVLLTTQDIINRTARAVFTDYTGNVNRSTYSDSECFYASGTFPNGKNGVLKLRHEFSTDLVTLELNIAYEQFGTGFGYGIFADDATPFRVERYINYMAEECNAILRNIDAR